MKKTYAMEAYLSYSQIQQLNLIAKSLLKKCLYQIIMINSQCNPYSILGKLELAGSCLELYLLVKPFSHSQIVYKTNQFPSKIDEIKNSTIKGEKQTICRLDQENNVLVKLVKFINSFIQKYTFFGQKQIHLEIGQLGYIKFQNFKAQYFNTNNILRWSLLNYAQAPQPRLQQLIGTKNKMMQSKQLKSKRRSQLSSILASEILTNEKMSRKFSLSSFKSYDTTSVQSQHKNNKTKQRVNSLPSISNQSAKAQHKEAIKKIRNIKQSEKIKNQKINQNYLKINRKLSLFSQKRQSILKSEEQIFQKITQSHMQSKQINTPKHVISHRKISNAQKRLSQFSKINKMNNKSEANLLQFEQQNINNVNENLKQDQKLQTELDLLNLMRPSAGDQSQISSQLSQSRYFNSSKQSLTLQFSRSIASKTIKQLSSAGTKTKLRISSLKNSNRQQPPKQNQKYNNENSCDILKDIPKRQWRGGNIRLTGQIQIKNDHSLRERENQTIKIQQQRIQTIKRFLCHSPQLLNQQSITNELLEAYNQQATSKIINDVLISKLFKAQPNYDWKSSKIKFYQKNCKLKMNKINITLIQQNVEQRHQNNKFIQSLISQLQCKLDQRQLKKYRKCDASDPLLYNFISSIFKLIQIHVSKINRKVQQKMIQFLARQQQQLLIKRKFDKYKFNSCKHQTSQNKSNGNNKFVPFEYTKPEDYTAYEFASDSEKKMIKLTIDYYAQKKQTMRKYYYQNAYMPYFYVLHKMLLPFFISIFDHMKRDEVIYVQLKGLNCLNETINQHLIQIRSLYSLFIDIFAQIPQKAFSVQGFQLQIIKNSIRFREDHINQCLVQWEQQIIQRYQPFEKYLHNQMTESLKFKDNYKKNINNLLIKQREQEVRKMQQKLAKLINIKAFIRTGSIILDTNGAKLQLIHKLESAISRIYRFTYDLLNAVSLNWSQQMVRTQRLLADQLAEEQSQISTKIRYLSKDYILLTKFYFLNRKYLYDNKQTISQNNNQSIENKNVKNSCKQFPKIIYQNTMKDINKIAIYSKQMMFQSFERCINYSYNMCKKNQQKMIQIAYLVQKHRQKVQFLAKSLEPKQKQSKIQYMQITNEMKKIIKQIRNKSDLLNYQTRIKNLHSRFKIYEQNSEKLHQQMTKICMIVWQDDEFLQNNFKICLRTLNFMDSEIYRRINYQTVDNIRFQHFFKYYKNLQKLMSLIEGHRFEQIFQSEFDLSQKQFQFIEMALYKDYTVNQLQQLNINFGLDVRPTFTNTKVSDLLKLIRSKSQVYKGVCKIYYSRKKQKYVKNLQKQIKLQIELTDSKEGQLIKIINYEQIKMILQQQIANSNLTKKQIELRQLQLQIASKIMEIHQIICNHQTILRQMDSDIKQEDHVNTVMHLEKLKLHYHNAIQTFKNQKNFVVAEDTQLYKSTYRQKQWEKLLTIASQLQNFRLKNKFYNYLYQICCRLIMIPGRSLICLMDWSTQINILRNIKILFSQVIDVEFGDKNSILAIYVSRGKSNDRIQMVSGPIYINKNEKKAKLIRSIEKQVNKSLLSMIKNSNGRTGQIKLLNWHLYFTEQVQLFIIQNSSLKILASSLNDIICSIKCDLRYDIFNHKDQQICQLNTFIHYITDVLGQFPQIDSFEWASTIKLYEKKKNSCVMIQQNNLEYYYGFEPKSVSILHAINWNLGLSTCYSDKSVGDLYKYKAYIIGVPYFQIKQLGDSYLSEFNNIAKFVMVLQSNSYIVSIFQPKQNQLSFKNIFNQVHKQIFNFFYLKSKRILEYTVNNSKALLHSGSDMNSMHSPQLQKSIKSIKDRISQEENKNQKINQKSKLCVHMCYQDFKLIPPCFLSIYRTQYKKRYDPDNIKLQINLLVECTILSTQLKSKLIWILIKLANSISSIKNYSLQNLLDMIKNVLLIIQKNQGQISKQVKNQIYCYIVDSLLSDYTAASTIVNQLFKPEEFQNHADTVQNSKQFKLQSEQSRFSTFSRKSLIDTIQKQYDQIKKNTTKPIVIYGEQPSCKTTFITKILQLQLQQIGGYIQSTQIQKYSSDAEKIKLKQNGYQSHYNLTEQQFFPYPVIEAGSLSHIDPKILGMCQFIYVPALHIQHNLEYQDELKIYFQTSIVSTGSIIDKIFLQKLWFTLLIMGTVYYNLKIKTNSIKFTHLIDLVLKIFSQFLLKKQNMIDSSKKNMSQQNEQLQQNRMRKQYQIFFMICYQLITLGIAQKALKKLYNEQLRIQLNKNNFKLQFKYEDIESMVYTNQFEIMKYDGNFSSKYATNLMKKQLLSSMNRQAFTIIRNIELGCSISVSGNNLYLFNIIRDCTDSAFNALNQKSKSQFKQQSNKTFIVNSSMQNLHQTYRQLGSIYQKKKIRLNLSKGMVSGKIMELASTRGNILNGSDRSIKVLCQRTLIFVDDLHLGTPDSLDKLSTILNRINNKDYQYQYKYIQQIFILFRQSTAPQNSFSNRLRRHTVQIAIPDLQIQSIFKYRLQTMGNEQQANLPSDLFKIGLFGQFEQDLFDKAKQQQCRQIYYGQSYLDFLISTNLKLPSQFYIKFILNKLCLMLMSPFCLNVPSFEFNPAKKIKSIISLFQSSQQTSKLADKLGCKNTYIRYKKDQMFQIDGRTVEMQIKKCLSNLAFNKRIVAEMYVPHLWLLTNARFCVVKCDVYGLIPQMHVAMTQKRIRYLTHNYLKQLIQQISVLKQKKEAQTTIVVPEYLLKYPQFTSLIRCLLQAKEVLIENKYLFEYWWECVSEQQFIENKNDQYLLIKEDIEQVIANRLNFIFNINSSSFNQALYVISGTLQSHLSRSQYSQQHNKKILQPSINQFRILMAQQQAQINHKNCNQFVYKITKNIVLLNTQLTLQQKLILIQKSMAYYVAIFQPPPAAQPYVDITGNFLKQIIELYPNIQAKEDLDQNEKSEQNSNILFDVLDTLPKLIMAICEYFTDNSTNIGKCMPKTLKEILQKQNCTITDLLKKMKQRIQQLQEIRQSNKQQFTIYQKCYNTLSQHLKSKHYTKEQQYIHSYHKFHTTTDIEQKSTLKQSINEVHQYLKLKKGRYINQEYSLMKGKFIQQNQMSDQNKLLYVENKSNSFFNDIKSCFQLDNKQGFQNFPKKTDYIIETDCKNKTNIFDYIQILHSFIRFTDIDSKFVKLMQDLQESQYAEIIDRLSKLKNYINNYDSFQNCLQFAFKSSHFFKKFIEDSGEIQDQSILQEFKFIEYMNLLDTLTLCKIILKGLKYKIKNVDSIGKGFQDCVQFLKQIGNYKTKEKAETLDMKQQKDYDLQIKQKIYNIISDLILSKVKNNIRTHYEIHKNLELQNHENILMTLDNPKLLYPYKWQQIQNQIFNPTSHNGYEIYKKTQETIHHLQMKNSKSLNQKAKVNLTKEKQDIAKPKQRNSNLNVRRLTLQAKRLSINFKQKELSQNFLPFDNLEQSRSWSSSAKYIIVYDPHSELVNFIKHSLENTVKQYRKIIYLKNEEDSLGECNQNNQKLTKPNHVLTYYVYYFKINEHYITETHHQSLHKLNKILKILKRKQKNGQGQNDRLIVLVQHRFLCEDIKINAQFKDQCQQQFIINDGDEQRRKINNKTQQKKYSPVNTVYLELTQMDLVEHFNGTQIMKGDKNKRKNEMNQFEEDNFGTDAKQKQMKSLQNLHIQYNMCKNYIKLLIKSISENQSFAYALRDSTQNLWLIVKCLKNYQLIKTELLSEYYKQKLLRYDFYLDQDNLDAIKSIHRIIYLMLSHNMIPMDFITNISEYSSFEQIISKLVENQNKNIKAKKKVVKGKSIFFEDDAAKGEKSENRQIQKTFQLICKHFEEYKSSLYNKIYEINQNAPLNSQNYQQKQRILHEELGAHNITILVYQAFQNWILKQLLQENDKSKVTLIFDQQYDSFEMYLDSAITLIKQNKKIIFIVHYKQLERVQYLLHSVKIVWI